MHSFLTTAMRAGSCLLLAGSLAACGPDDATTPNLSHFSLSDVPAPGSWSLDPYDSDYAAAPQALPLSLGAQPRYDYAPSWDYRNDGYAQYDDGGAQYAQFASYDDGYAPYDSYAPMNYGDQDYYYDDAYNNQGGGTDQYAWLAVAALIAGVIGNSPPDYGYDYAGVQPWVWRTGDGYRRYAEPVRGGYRYYYYEPQAARPFLVRDPYYSYGYRDDRLVTIYDRYGRLIDARRAERQRRAASAYYRRADDLYTASNDYPHVGVPVQYWDARRDALAADRRALKQARKERAQWQKWERKHERKLAQRWVREQEARERAADRFAQWRETSYEGPAPRLYEPRRQADTRQVAVRYDGDARRRLDRRDRAERREESRWAQAFAAEREDTRRPSDDRFAKRAADRVAAKAQREAIREKVRPQAAQRTAIARQEDVRERRDIAGQQAKQRMAERQAARQLAARQSARAEKAERQQARRDARQAELRQQKESRRVAAAAQRKSEAQQRQVAQRKAAQEKSRNQAAQRQAAQQQAREQRAAERKASQEQARQQRLAQRQATQEKARQQQAAERQAAKQAAQQQQAAQRQAASERARQQQVAQRQAAQQQKAAQRQAAQEQARQKQAAQRQAAQEQARQQQAAQRQAAQQQQAAQRQAAQQQKAAQRQAAQQARQDKPDRRVGGRDAKLARAGKD